MNKQFIYLIIAVAITASNKTIASEYQETIANITQSTLCKHNEVENQHNNELKNLFMEYQQNMSTANDLKTKIAALDKYMKESQEIKQRYTVAIMDITHNNTISMQTEYKKEEKKNWDELSKK